MNALTAKQRALLDFIKAYSAMHQQAPSFDEMRQALGLQSKSGIHRLARALEERGYIRRLYHKARAIEIVDDPHLPTGSTLGGVPTADLAREVHRRGLVLGSFHRKSYRVGDKFHEHHTFREVYP